MRKILYILFIVPFFGLSQVVLNSNGGLISNAGIKTYQNISMTASIAATDNTATEASETTGTYTVTLNVASTGTTTVNYTVSGTATSASDFTALSGSIDVTNGNTTATITLTPIDDGDVEGDETVILTLTSGTGYVVGSPSSATVTITDDDSAAITASIAATDGTATESGTTTGTLTVTLSSASTGTTTVNYTVGGTATATDDYTALSGSVDITNGNTTGTITVTPVDDSDVEVNETVIVTLASGTGYTLGTPDNASVTIISEDSSGGDILASVSATDAIATETSTTTAEFTISLSEVNTGGTITVNYHMDGSATEGTDYTSTSGSVAITNGNQSATVIITPTDDSKIEFIEEALLVLDTGTGYSTEGFERAFIEITDNDDVSASYPTPSGSGTITNLSDFTNAANAGKTMTVTGSFSATGATAASGMVLIAGGGVISGTNINLNGSGIENSNTQLFANTVTFSSLYTLSRVSIEMFGAGSGDATDDHNAIETAIDQCQHLTARLNGAYVKNDTSTLNRSGFIDFDLNGSTIRTTSAVNFRTGSTDYSVDEVFRCDGINPYFYNGTFDLTDTYGRLFRVLNYTDFGFKDLVFENLYNPQPIRSYAIRGGGAANLTYGSFVRNIFRDITAQGDGSANNSDGISKGIWMECGTISDANFEIVHYGNEHYRITGDDAEAVYYTASGDRLHNGHTLFDNETYYDIGRRAIKMTKGQFTIQNSDFTEVSNTYYVSASLTATMVDVFSTTAVDLQNINVINNTLQTATGETIKRWLNSYTDSQDILIKGNTYTISDPYGLGAIRLGSNTSSYDGLLRGMTIKDNTFVNASIEWMQYYDGIDSDPIIIDNNTFTYNDVSGAGQAPMDFYNVGSDVKGYADFTNNTITFSVAPGGYDGIISSDGGSVTVTDILIDSNNITFSSGAATYEVGNIAGALTNSTVTNNTFTGASGNADLNIVGTQTGTTASGNTPTVTIN